jgi:hypothetical protein
MNILRNFAEKKVVFSHDIQYNRRGSGGILMNITTIFRWIFLGLIKPVVSCAEPSETFVMEHSTMENEQENQPAQEWKAEQTMCRELGISFQKDCWQQLHNPTKQQTLFLELMTAIEQQQVQDYKKRMRHALILLLASVVLFAALLLTAWFVVNEVWWSIVLSIAGAVILAAGISNYVRIERKISVAPKNW